MTPRRTAGAAVLAATLIGIGLATIVIVALRPPTAGQAAPTGPSAAQVVLGVEDPPRVADLMTKAGCDGALIGTQLYSRETGRCTYQGATVTIAAFDNDELRDRWLEFGRQYGGTFVVGRNWAAGLDKPDPAAPLAAALAGRVV